MAQLQWPAPPAMQIDVAKDYAVSIETNRGTIELALYPKHAPQTVNNFVFLAGQGYYDGVKFHRVIADFMIQTRRSDGHGPRRSRLQVRRRVQEQSAEARARRHLDGERGSEHERQPVLHHARRRTPHLNGKHTVFGKVTKGLDVVDAIRQGDVMVSVKVAD